MTIDLCVVNFNTKDKLQRLLESLRVDYVPDIWNLYIADNGSSDGSGMFLQETDYPYITEYVLNRNFGYAFACNQLAAKGSGEIIGLLNADVWMNSEDVRKIEAAFDDDDVAVIGPKQRNETGLITHAGIFGTNTEPKHRGWKEPDREDWLYRDRLEAVTVSGSAYFIRRSVWDELTNCPTYKQVSADARGAFLPTPHYYEETFCSYHTRAHGYKVIYDGTISIGHSWHASSVVGGEADQCFQGSREIFRRACDAHKILHD